MIVALPARTPATTIAKATATGVPREHAMFWHMGRPSYDEQTLAGYFHAPQEALFDDPVVGRTLRRLTEVDPDILAAVADVDRSQIRDCMKRSPQERLAFAVANWNGIARFRRGG